VCPGRLRSQLRAAAEQITCKDANNTCRHSMVACARSEKKKRQRDKVVLLACRSQQ
jgi:hypothetical protein